MFQGFPFSDTPEGARCSSSMSLRPSCSLANSREWRDDSDVLGDERQRGFVIVPVTVSHCVLDDNDPISMGKGTAGGGLDAASSGYSGDEQRLAAHPLEDIVQWRAAKGVVAVLCHNGVLWFRRHRRKKVTGGFQWWITRRIRPVESRDQAWCDDMARPVQPPITDAAYVHLV